MSKEYQLVSVSDKGVHTSVEDHFQRKIQYLINTGWQLQAGVSVCSIDEIHGNPRLVFVQGLMRIIHDQCD
jgi:hypothetical protein